MLDTNQKSPAGLFLFPSAEIEACLVQGSDVAALARALASSPLWEEMPTATIIARPTPRPALGVAGRFDTAARARLEALRSQIVCTAPGPRYVDYRQAERDCERLARRLIGLFGREELRRCRFAAVPRGGYIVLGMLAYSLELDARQLESPAEDREAGPLVVVDDCSISGSRFGGFLRGLGGREVIFAHLYSHPDLRGAIEEREPSVLACVAARDLADHAPERLGAGYEVWRRRCSSREAERDELRYWIGQPEHLAFPWNEPDTAFWNPVTETLERGANLVPPELCMKNRSQAPSVYVQVQPAWAGPLRPGENVVYGEFEDGLILGDLRTGESFGLAGFAADLWSAVVRHGSPEAAVEALAADYEVERDTLRADAADFVADLVAQGLLENLEAPAVLH